MATSELDQGVLIYQTEVELVAMPQTIAAVMADFLDRLRAAAPGGVRSVSDAARARRL